MLWQFPGEHWRTQPYIHKHVSILPYTPLPSRLLYIEQSPCAVQLVIHVKYSSVYLCIPNSLNHPFPQQKDSQTQRTNMVAGVEGRMQESKNPLSSLSEILNLFSYPHFLLSLLGCLFIIFISLILFLRFTLNVVCTYNLLIHSFTLLLVFHYINTTWPIYSFILVKE